jgi:hypothetical protein
MKTFFMWLESLGWQSALCFLIAVSISICVVILLIDAGLVKLAHRREQREIAERIWAEKKRRAQYLLDAQREREAREDDDAEFMRRLEIDVKRDDLQSRREARQLHIPAAFRDMKGITKQ